MLGLDFAYVKVNYDAASRTDVGWIAWDVILILFRLNILNILCVKQFEKQNDYLSSSLFHNQIIVDCWGVCPDWIQILVLLIILY